MPVENEIEATTRVHPESEPYAVFMLRSWCNALLRPKIRLQNQCPWGLKEFSRVYAIALVYYVAGSLLPIGVIFCGIWLAIKISPDQVVPLVATSDGSFNPNVMLIVTAASFVSGFGAELFYFDQQLRKTGSSLQKVIGLNLDSLNGSWFEAVKRAFVALLVSLCIQNLLDALPLHRPHQATADMAGNLTGLGLVSFGVLVALMAPIMEEIVFRGCVFNALRNIFREGRLYDMLRRNEHIADCLAVCLSGVVFAAAHMDVNAFPQLLVLGIVLAELYRRSGSLVCPILLHAMNNLVATLMIVAK